MRRYISDLKLLGEKKLRGKFKDIVKEFRKLY
jgi:hypothetical protein